MRPETRKTSVRMHLLIWNTCIVAVCLLGFCALFRTILQVRLLALVDSQLTDRSVALIKLWNSIPIVARDAVREQLGNSQIGSRLFVPDDDPKSPPISRPDESLTGIYRPRAFGPDGKSYLRGLNDSQLDPAAFQRAFKGETVHSTVVLNGTQLRVITMPVQSDDEVPFVLQSARDLRDYNAEITEITRDLLKSIPVLLIVSAAAGYLLTARALRPVREIRLAAEKINGEDLSRRLPVTGSDEFAGLAETLNSMFTRVDLAAEEYRQALEKVHRSAETMSRLVDQLLLLSKADTEQRLFEPETVTIADVVDSALESFSPEESSRVRTEIPAALRTSGSFSLLQRVIENLISNSLSYADPNLPICISACAHSQELCTITVKDGGNGIKPEELPRIRERFYRSNVARSIRSGSGLGLAICDSIIKAHHGTMQIHSEPGNGTVVTLELLLHQ